jgi:hypothetical protein
VKSGLAVASNAPEETLMNLIQATLGATLALATPAVPSVAQAQDSSGYYSYGYEEQPYAPYETSTSTVNVAPPTYASVYVYEGRRLMSRFDGPGALWLPTGHIYRVVAMRGDQVIWTGNISTTGAPIDLRWAPPQASYYYRRGCGASPYAYPPARPVTPPTEWGRERTPLP